VASNADSYSDDLHKIHKHCSKSFSGFAELNPCAGDTGFELREDVDVPCRRMKQTGISFDKERALGPQRAAPPSLDALGKTTSDWRFSVEYESKAQCGILLQGGRKDVL